MGAFVIAVAIGILITVLIIAIASNRQEQTPFSPDQIDTAVFADEELLSYFADQKIAAIKRYRDLTGAGLKEAKQAVEYLMANPDALHRAKKLKSASLRLGETEAHGIQQMIADGDINKAIDVYAQFMGVDRFTAESAINEMVEELDASDVQHA